MRLGITLLAAMIAPSIAYATTLPDKDGMRWTIIDPPAKYLREIPRLNALKLPDYGSSVELYEMPQAELKDMCSFWAAKSEQLGCSFPQADPCQVYVNSDVPLLYRQRIIQHEVAHCMGWPADHPVD